VGGKVGGNQGVGCWDWVWFVGRRQQVGGDKLELGLLIRLEFCFN
jgi:hypothetical protein